MVTVQFPRVPCSFRRSMVFFMLSMVGVMRVERHRMSMPSPLTVSAILEGATSFPRSLTMYPPAVSMVLTMFFPMSWTSPSTTAVAAFFASARSSLGMAGSRRSSPAYIAWAATRTWGR